MSNKLKALRFFRFITLVIPLAFAMIACENDKDCNEILDTPVNLKFKLKVQGSENKYKDTTLVGLSAYIAGQDTILFADSVSQSNLQLFLNPNEDECKIVLSLPISVVPPPGGEDFILLYDTLSFTYNRSTRFVSVGCGFIMQFELLTFEHTGRFFQKMDTINLKVSNDFKTHLEMVLFPADSIKP